MKKCIIFIALLSMMFTSINPVPAQELDVKLIKVAGDDFKNYPVSRNTNFKDYPSTGESNLNAGEGFADKWSADYADTVDFSESWPKLSTINGGSAYGTRTTGKIYRQLADTIATDTDATYYFKFQMSITGAQDGSTGLNLLDGKITVGNASKDGSIVAAIDAEGDISYGTKIVNDDRSVHTYIVKLDIFAQDEDIISLKVYNETETPEEVPSSWDVYKNIELGTDGIKNIGLSFFTQLTYFNNIDIYIEEKMSEEELADRTPMSSVVNIRDDMHHRIYLDKNNTEVNNAQLQLSPNTGWEINEIKALDGWEKSWMDVDDKYNIFNLNGTKYELKVDATLNNSTDGQAVALSYEPESLYYEYDIDNGHYDSINILASNPNEYYSNAAVDKNSKHIGIILVYEDGEEEIVVQRLYPTTADREGEQEQIVSNLYSSVTDPSAGKGYVHEYVFGADDTKILDKVRILKSRTELNEDNTAINYENGFNGLKWTYYATSTEEYIYYDDEGRRVVTTLGEYLMDTYGTGESANMYNTYGHIFYGSVLAVTAVNTIADYKEILENKISLWPDNPDVSVARQYTEEFNKVYEDIEEMKSKGSNVSALEDNEKYAAMKQMISRIPTINKSELAADMDNAYFSVEFSIPVDNINPTITKGGTSFTDYTTDINDNVVTFTFDNDFDYTSTYSITLNSSIYSAADHTITLGSEKVYEFTLPKVFDVSAFALRDKDGNAIEDENDIYSDFTYDIVYGDFSVTNYLMPSIDVGLTVAVFSPDGEMVASASKTAQLQEGESIGWDNLMLDTGLESLKDCKVRMYIWDSFEKMNTIYPAKGIDF